MGYFRRKLDRCRAGRELRGLAQRAAELGPWAPWPGANDQGPPRAVFLRFSIPDRHPFSERRSGLFVAAYRLLRRGEVDAGLRATLEAELDWFGEHLPSPDLDEERAIFFRSDGGESLCRIWTMLHLLRSAGLQPWMQSVRSPGRVVYEDEYQVAAIPWTRLRHL